MADIQELAKRGPSAPGSPSRGHSRAASEWLSLAADNYRVAVSDELAALFAEEMAGFSRGDLDDAFRCCLRELRFFPTLADVLARLPRRIEYLRPEPRRVE